ncbi:hypothetical protein [Kibdelosporangium philippinense]|uniref:hypothetical protein n=1 Tax=Kibdelosporangium philippinense TaxID=211113 RepID=UPI003615B0B5
MSAANRREVGDGCPRVSAAPAWRVERERRTAASDPAGGESSSLTRRAGGADTR